MVGLLIVYVAQTEQTDFAERIPSFVNVSVLSGWLWSLKDKEAIEESKMDKRKKKCENP